MTDNTLETLDLHWALNATLPPLDFVLPGLEPGAFGLIVAPGGTGKTFFGLDLAVSIALGREVAGGLFPAASPAKAVYLAAEESRRMLAERLRTLTRRNECADDTLYRNLVIAPMLGKDSALIRDKNTTRLYDALKTHAQGARLIIVDPIRQLHDGEENDSASAAKFVAVMGQLASACGAAVIGIHHANRSADASSQNAARGSSALVDGARWQLNLARMSADAAQEHGIKADEQTQYIALEVVKANYLAPIPGRWLKRNAGGRLSLVDLPKKNSSKVPQNLTRQYGGANLL